jgi:adenosylcobinamide-GDP ribazoletransferase
MQPPPEPTTPQASSSAFLSGARAALAFLTRIPCGKRPVTEQALAWAPAWFPAVGYLLGLAGGLVFAGLDRAGGLVASTATVAFLALVTGAFHEDGLADSADALGGALDRPKLFAILKDSRIGSFGATALLLVLLLRVVALAKLGPLTAGGLLLGQTVSRAAPVWLMAIMPYVTPAETAYSSRLVHARSIHALVASAFALAAASALVLGALLPLRGTLVATLAAVLVTAVCGWRFHVRAGGITGDFLGATQQLADAAILVALAAS